MAEFDTISKHLIQKYPDDFAGFSLGRALSVGRIGRIIWLAWWP